MEAELQSQVAFHLTGKRPRAGLDAVDPGALQPALLARYRDLDALRYDFPLVLVQDANGDSVAALSGLIDGILHEIAQGDDAERITRHVLRLERRIRALVAQGTQATLASLWDMAAGQLGADAGLRESLARARAALKVDGEVVGCDAALPVRLARHAWAAVQRKKARRFGEDVARLIQKLSDILRADFVGSEAGRSAESLKASVGSAHAEVFDFAAMSRLLAKGSRPATLSDARRERIQRLLAVLEAQNLYPVAGRSSNALQPLSFLFDSCGDALEAYRQRSLKVAAVAKAMAMAELEVAGEFREAQHAAFFNEFGEDGLAPEELAPFPDYLVCVNTRKLSASESATLMEILSAGLPMKIMAQNDDILATSRIGEGGFGTRDRQLANMAMGLNNVYVMQCCSSNLFQFRDRLRAGLAYRGPALFSVFSGANVTSAGLPTYLVAAAAMESRAFPAFCYDPSAGSDWASRFFLDTNPQPDRDWPVQGFAYEDEAHQSVTEDIAFTLVDFVACDGRYAKHFARVARAQWTERMLPAAECLARDPESLSDTVPYVSMVDRDNLLQRVIVDEKLMREARRCRESWHSLQELAGIHNSHAARLLEREAKAREERIPAAAPAPTAASPAPAAAAPAAEAAPERSPEEAYIETTRCTSCNECTKINDKMFAYNENKQAYIKDLAAGTYGQLVEAAESCQVSIIHPGKPRNPNEPDLEDLQRRAAAFQ